MTGGLVPIEAVSGELVAPAADGMARFCAELTSPATAAGYRGHLRRFAQSQEIFGLDDVSREAVLAYERDLRERHARPGVIRGARVAINSFVRWADQRGLPVDAEILDLPLPRYAIQADDAAPKSLRRGQYEMMLKVALAQTRKAGEKRGKRRRVNPVGVRNYAMLAVLGDCGLRNAELRKLRVHSMVKRRSDFAHKQLVVDGKGSYQRTVPLTERAQEAVEAWLDLRDELAPLGDFMFVGFDKSGRQVRTSDAPISSRTLERTVEKIGRVAGLPAELLTVHTLRHTYATLALTAGMPLQLLQKRLGHASVQTTVRYVHEDADSLEAEMGLLNRAIADAR